MSIAIFIGMLLITLAVVGYPLVRRGAPATQEPATGQPAQRVVCARCGRLLEADERFCPQCGTPAGLRCAHCGRPLRGDEIFCPGCGKKVGEICP